MKSVRKLALMFLTLSFMLIGLCGCMSESEKKIASEYEDIALPVIEKYIEDNHSEYDIDSIDNITVLESLFETKATRFVKAKVSMNKDKDTHFEIIYDTENDIIYSNNGVDQIIETIISAINIKDTIVRAEFISKELIDSEVNGINYYKINNKNPRDYKIYLNISSDNSDDLNTIYSKLDLLRNIDYQARIIIGDRLASELKPFSLKDRLEIDADEICKDTGTVIVVNNESGKTTEDIIKFSREDINDGYIIYDSTRYKIDRLESSSNLGESQSKIHGYDSKILIKSIDASNTNIRLTVLSDKYRNIAYQFKDSTITTEEMTPYSILSLLFISYSYIEDLNIDTPKELSIGLYNVEKQENKS